jgi:gas vesicle protein
MKKNKKGMSGGKMLAGVAGAAALGAGAYYLLGPDAKKHQKKVSVLAAKMKKEVEVEIKKAQKAGTPMYHKVVDMISENYAKQYQMHEPEIKALAKKLKSEWKSISKKPTKKTVKSSKKK